MFITKAPIITPPPSILAAIRDNPMVIRTIEIALRTPTIPQWRLWPLRDPRLHCLMQLASTTSTHIAKYSSICVKFFITDNLAVWAIISFTRKQVRGRLTCFLLLSLFACACRSSPLLFSWPIYAAIACEQRFWSINCQHLSIYWPPSRKWDVQNRHFLWRELVAALWCRNQTRGTLCFNLLRSTLTIKPPLVSVSGHVMLRVIG